MIYVTVGTMDFTFSRLTEALGRLPESIRKDMVAQVGVNELPAGVSGFRYCSRDEAERYIDQAELVITHGGSTLMEALLKGKKVVAVPRKADNQEAMNDHQLHLCNKLAEKGLVTTVLDMADLGKAIEVELGKDRPIISVGPLPGRFLQLLKDIEVELR